MQMPLPGDKGAAYTGFVIAVVSLLIILGTMVVLTNRKFEGHTAGASQQQHP
jgi:hypothetical protein